MPAPPGVRHGGAAKIEFQQKGRCGAGAAPELAPPRPREGLATLEPATVQTYQRVLKLRGSAVAEVRDEFCMGCSTKVTAQNFMEVMRNDRIHHCPHCQRILYYLRPEVRPARRSRRRDPTRAPSSRRAPPGRGECSRAFPAWRASSARDCP
jgi:DNA-directed RNA polymerase subunit RPC12/RpoP